MGIGLDPPIPVAEGEKVLFMDVPFSSRICSGVIERVTRTHVSLKCSSPAGEVITTLDRKYIVGVTPRCKGKFGKERCQRGKKHKGKHFSHTSYGTAQWTDKKPEKLPKAPKKVAEVRVPS